MNNDRKVHQPATDTTALYAGRIAIGTKEAARLLSISRNTLYTWLNTTDIPYKRVGTRIVFSPKLLEEWVARTQGNHVTARALRA